MAFFNRLASYLVGRPIPDLTSGFRGARTSGLREFLHLLPNGFSTPTTTTLAFLKAGYAVAFGALQVASGMWIRRIAVPSVAPPIQASWLADATAMRLAAKGASVLPR